MFDVVDVVLGLVLVDVMTSDEAAYGGGLPVTTADGVIMTVLTA
jgi:hypothetical protein